jgi:hypothetical protein
MFGKLKSNLLTYLFKDWVKNITRTMLRQRVNLLEEGVNTGRIIIKGFNRE